MKNVPVFKGTPPELPTRPPPPPMDPGLLDLKAAAAWLHTSTRFVHGEARLGRLRVIKMGKLVRFDMKDLVEYVEARKSGGLVPVVQSEAPRQTPAADARP